MKMRISGKQSEKSILKYSIGILATFIMAIALSLLAPIFIIFEYLESQHMWLLTVILHIIATFAGAWISGILTTDRSIGMPAVIGGVWFLLVLGTGILLFDAKNVRILPALIGCVTGAGLAYLLRLSHKSGGIRGRKRKRQH